MGKIDFLLDKVQRHLDELRMEYKKNGAESCADNLEHCEDAFQLLFKEIDKCI